SKGDAPSIQNLPPRRHATGEKIDHLRISLSREEYPISIVLCQPAFDFGSVMMKYAQNRKWTGSRSCNDASFSWRLRSNFYRRTAWTHPAAARFSLDLFVNKQLRPEF